MPLSVLRSWSEHDYTTAVALTLHEADLCSGCGHPMSETSANAYLVPPPTRCLACDAIESASGAYKGSAHPAALRFGAVMKT